MSANGEGNGDGSDDGDSGPGTREVAYRLFAAEFEDCDFQFSESDEERAPNFVITPTGGRVNRMFLVGVLTELEQVNQSMLRARIVDPTGAFVVYAGQYQPEALSFLERTDPPAFLAVTGKARTYQPEDTDVVYSSVRPESISEVDAATRDRWVVSTAEQTLDRIGVMAAAIESGHSGDVLRQQLEDAGVDAALAQGVSLAREHYGTTPAYLDALRDLSLDATRVVANERDEAGSLDIAPDEGGEADLAMLQPPDAPSISGGAADTSTGASPTEGADDATDTTASESPSKGEAAAAPGGDATATGTTESTDTAEASEPSDTTAAETTAEPASAEATATEATATDSRGTDSPETTGTDEGTSTTAETTEPGETMDSTETAEPAATPEPDTGEADDDIGEFEPGEFDAEEPEEDPLGDEVREQVEEEYGPEFSTGTEVESEPDLEPEAEPESTPEPEAEAEPEAEPEPESESTDTDAGDAEPAEDVDLSEAVMDAMQALDDGDGAPTDAVIERVVDRTGASPDEVDDAVQDALMGGQCYEPEDGLLKPI
jgi:RPA family protein